LDPSEGSFTLVKSREGQCATALFKCKKVSSLMNEFGHAHLDILKIDIEGFEYGVIEDIFENDLSISQICVEFHHFFDNIPFAQTRKAIKTLKNRGYDLVHKTGSDYLFVKI
jgi:glutamine amidotransferase PdxT